MSYRPIMAVLAGCLIPILSGCGSVDGPDGPTIKARLSPEVIGRPVAPFLGADARTGIQTVALANGAEQVEIIRAGRDEKTGETMFCRETLIHQGGIITGYTRRGNSCGG